MWKRLVEAVRPRSPPPEPKRVLAPHLAGGPLGHTDYFPHHPWADTYLVPRVPEPAETHVSSSLPVPSTDVRQGYGESIEDWLAFGQRDVATMREILARAGKPAESAGRILEMGCNSGRMIRWLQDLAAGHEVWGTDVSASHVLWCKQHLRPPFHFATTTLMPHLPFEDRYFGLVYAGSVFTHIDDLADAWFLELRRVLRPGGMLYVTIHDRHTVELLKGAYHDHPLNGMFRDYPEYGQYAGSDFGMFTIGRYENSQVFYDPDYLARSLAPFFSLRDVVPGAYRHQTALLLERV